MSYSINIILGLATAALGFSINLLRDEAFNLSCWGKSFFVFACISFLLSIAFGILVTLNRLKDFRLTAQKARIRENRTDEEKLELYILRYISDEILGKLTWTLFRLEIGFFSAGILFLVFTIVSVFGYKII